MSNEVYQPLSIELDGCYEKSLSELDAGLQVRVNHVFLPGWDYLTESQRRSYALDYDYGNDPKHEPVLYFELWQFMDTLSAMEIKARAESKEAVALVIVDVKKQIESLLNTDRETVGREIQELRSNVQVGEKPLSDKTDRAHVSDSLATLNQASATFWANADPNDNTTHPLNSTVETWLIERKFSPTMAEKGATIIRPKWATRGRKADK